MLLSIKGILKCRDVSDLFLTVGVAAGNNLPFST